MVTIKNDIESSGSFLPTTQPDKDVNLRDQGVKPRRRRSYRCTAIVLVVVLLLMALGVGGILFFGPAVNRIPLEAKDGMPSSTQRTLVAEEPPPLPPSFADPFDRTSDGPQTAVNPTDGVVDDDEFDIDGPTTAVLVTSSVPTTTKQTMLWIDINSGFGSDSEDDDYYSEEYGSGSGFGELRDS
ncbi:uncharacterized protein LOC134223288 [Armigeres subalbatus]|uniref:uncharacterized protein LOC134223288 n=1 Tax=Armigeres subalbatus TaxID=124917 RepID=UPI002ED3A4A2